MTTVVNFFGMGSFFLRFLVFMDMYFDCNYLGKILGDYTMKKYKCYATQKQNNKKTRCKQREENQQKGFADAQDKEHQPTMDELSFR